MINNKYPNISPSLNLDFTNSNTIDPRITFSRASAATYYDGKTVAKAEENLLTYSQEFDNSAWGKSGATVLSNATAAPDGSTTADLIVANTSNVPHCVFRSSAATEATISFYAKSGGYNFVAVCDAAGGQIGKFTVDLTNGVISENSASIQASVANAGGGWWRVVLYKIFANAFQLQIGPTDSSTGGSVYNTGVFPGDGISGIYLWGAQLEQRSQVTAYTPTTTQPITNYIPVLQTALSGVPRIDHDPVTGECKGLLIEEQRTNLLVRSEEFSAGPWVLSLATIAPNSAVAPDGSLSADRLISSASASIPSSYVIQGVAKSASAIAYTASVYAKKGGLNRVTILLVSDTSANRASVTFSLDDGSIVLPAAVLGGFSSPSAQVTSLPNGWYRFSLTATTDSFTSVTHRINLTDSVLTIGDGYSGIYIWGAQLEAGSFPTSYIKTEASQVTRAADSAAMTGANFSSWYRQDEGTILTETAAIGYSVSDRYIYLFSETGSINPNSISARTFNGAGVAAIYAGGTIQASFSNATIPVGNFSKSALAYKASSTNSGINGALGSEDVSQIIPNVVRMDILPNACRYYKRFSYYPKRLSNTQLQALTA